MAVADALRGLDATTRDLVSEAEKLLSLVLSLPISSANAERSFSTLRRLKTWIRSTMTKRRLTNLALAHVHQDILDNLDFRRLQHDFIQRNAERKSVFGKL